MDNDPCVGSTKDVQMCEREGHFVTKRLICHRVSRVWFITGITVQGSQPHTLIPEILTFGTRNTHTYIAVTIEGLILKVKCGCVGSPTGRSVVLCRSKEYCDNLSITNSIL